MILHCHPIWPEGLECGGVDIFGLDDQREIVEPCDVPLVLPDPSANPNGMF